MCVPNGRYALGRPAMRNVRFESSSILTCCSAQNSEAVYLGRPHTNSSKFATFMGACTSEPVGSVMPSSSTGSLTLRIRSKFTCRSKISMNIGCNSGRLVTLFGDASVVHSAAETSSRTALKRCGSFTISSMIYVQVIVILDTNYFARSAFSKGVMVYARECKHGYRQTATPSSKALSLTHPTSSMTMIPAYRSPASAPIAVVSSFVSR
jgi:hypothetical protein